MPPNQSLGWSRCGQRGHETSSAMIPLHRSCWLDLPPQVPRCLLVISRLRDASFGKERPHARRAMSRPFAGPVGSVFVWFVYFVVPTLCGVEARRMASLRPPSLASRPPRPRMQPVHTAGSVGPRNTRNTRKKGLRVPGYATAAANDENKSPGRAWRRRHVTAMGRSPSCLT